MHSKTDVTFQAVPVSDNEDVSQHEQHKRKSYTPPGTRAPVLIALLCIILALIALLQVAVSKSVKNESGTSSTSGLRKRQITMTSLDIYTGLVQTITGTTITWAATTATYPSRTMTIPATTQTITGTTNSFPGSTNTIVEVINTQSGTTNTLYYQIETIDGTITSIFLPLATTAAAYLDTSTPVVTSATNPSAYMDTSTPSSSFSMPTPEATPSSAYLDTSIPSSVSSRKSSLPVPAPSPSPSPQPDVLSLPQIDRIVAGKYTTSRYLMATYLAPICVVVLKCITGLVFASANMMEPFHRLAQVDGADGRVSLLADFLSSSVSMNILSGVDFKRPLMLIVTIGFAISTILAPFASEAMSIKGSQECVTAGQSRKCAPVWVLDLICVRLLQALLSLMFCIFVAYALLSYKRSSSVFSDPTSIASIASFLGNRDFVQELRNIPSNASKKEIKKLLGGNKYALGTFPTGSGDYAYGIYKTQSVRDDMSKMEIRQVSRQPKTPSRKGGFIQDLIRLILSVGVLSIVLAYYLDMRNDPFNRFFNSDAFGPRFILSALAMILDNRFRRLEQEVRIMQPFRDLYKQSGASANTLLTNTVSSSYTSFPLALWRGKLFLALVAFATILADVLIIVIVGVPFSDAEIYSAFRVSTWLSIAVLSMMAITSVATMIWRRGNPPMPREPNTIISIALYLCASQVTEQLVSTSTVEEAIRNESIKALGQSYWYGYGLGQDEKSRWMVDKTDEGNH